jgi:hypothetical protein
MDEQPATNHARRRSSSLAGAPGTSNKDPQKHRRHRSGQILEEGEDASTSDDEHSDSSGRTDSTDLELDDMRSNDGLEDDEETGLTGSDRRRRRRRKRRNTRLDQRIVEDVRFTKDEEKMANQTLIHSMLINTLLIGLWYELRPVQELALNANTFQVPLLNFHLSLQQVDVQARQRRRPDRAHISIPAIHDLPTHDCTIFPSLSCTLFDTLVSSSTRFSRPTRVGAFPRAYRPQETSNDKMVLRKPHRSLRCRYRHGYWARKYKLEIYFFDILQ